MGGRLGERRLSYRRFVEEGLLREIDNPLDAVSWQTVLGREHFLQRVKDRLASRKEHRELPALRQLRRRPDVQSILEGVAKVYRCSKEQLLERGRKGNEARAVAMVLIWDCCGMRLREIGELFGGVAYTAVAQMIARTKEKDRRSKLKFKLNNLWTNVESEDLTPISPCSSCLSALTSVIAPGGATHRFQSQLPLLEQKPEQQRLLILQGVPSL